jgi:hypothetical protein
MTTAIAMTKKKNKHLRGTLPQFFCTLLYFNNHNYVAVVQYPSMERTIAAFKGYPSQEAVATMMLKLGICVKNDSAYCGDIELSDSALGRAAGVDRRVARATIDKIYKTPSLLAVFSKMKSMALLSDVAPEIGCTTLEIIPTDAHMPGILADVTATIFNAGVSVRQAVVDNPGLQKNSHLIVVIDGQLPSEYLPKLKLCRGVNSIIIR